MVSLNGFGKPQYLFRPMQIVRRLPREFRRGDAMVKLPWRLDIEVDPRDTLATPCCRQESTIC